MQKDRQKEISVIEDEGDTIRVPDYTFLDPQRKKEIDAMLRKDGYEPDGGHHEYLFYRKVNKEKSKEPKGKFVLMSEEEQRDRDYELQFVKHCHAVPENHEEARKRIEGKFLKELEKIREITNEFKDRKWSELTDKQKLWAEYEMLKMELINRTSSHEEWKIDLPWSDCTLTKHENMLRRLSYLRDELDIYKLFGAPNQ